jgi:transglutaminase-like putative cysteine protease
MPSLTIRHLTIYRYRQPVGFGEHRMMLRPRDSHDQRVIEANLEISPQPTSLRFIQDAFGNHVGIARFSGRSEELRFDSTVHLEHSPLDATGHEIEEAAFPVAYSADEMPDLANCIERQYPDPGKEVSRWALQFVPSNGSIGASRYSPGSHRTSNAASFTGGGKRRGSSRQRRHSGLATAAAEILPF